MFLHRLPPCGGSGLKLFLAGQYKCFPQRLPPCGGSGLKYAASHVRFYISGLPPCGGSGLKYEIRQKHQKKRSLPPCGGSGLKSYDNLILDVSSESPSVWREWIEIRSSLLPLVWSQGLPPCGGSGLKFN